MSLLPSAKVYVQILANVPEILRNMLFQTCFKQRPINKYKYICCVKMQVKPPPLINLGRRHLLISVSWFEFLSETTVAGKLKLLDP